MLLAVMVGIGSLSMSVIAHANSRQISATNASTGFDALAPDIASNLASHGGNVGAVVYDINRQQYYSYNGSNAYIMASSMKVPIMLTFLHSMEQQGREPNANELSLLTTMIENSNNDSATALYNEIGHGAAIANYLQSIGVAGFTPNDNAWGYSTMTPQGMVDLLTRLQNGSAVNANHRTLALNLMSSVESDQRFGVGDTTPAGTSVAMKNGWVPGPDNLWAVNTSGIVNRGNQSYIVSVYTQENPSMAAGQSILEQVCQNIATHLLA
ncbi:hypothetical protein KDI_03400 [Dictyobacter arantiisoli]|uniref:Beta-lactamase class A catalytic domain-containing protein n=2 Tax=Dictyobacter arantiisoli TaxID=2014874 RepID=A0A5A5T6H0_9CHLR|nr:hypothetical protein KDI_03400 [Dictyobacter arantiisoli]